MLSVIGFLVILGPLVVFHELGHYLFAKLFGVKAEVFSIGFGPKLWSKQVGETEWRVAAIPLGGFVKLLGEDTEESLPPELAKRTLHAQEPWKRFLIFFGGPLFNFVLAVLVFAFILLIGEPQLASQIGRVTRGSQAESMGFRSGDLILAIDGTPVRKYEEVYAKLNESSGKSLVFDLERKESPRPDAKAIRLQLEVRPGLKDGYSIYGEEKPVGEIDGIFPHARTTDIALSNPNSLAAQKGVQSGDKITQFDGVLVESWEQVEALYADAKAEQEILVVLENGKKISFVKPKRWRSPGNDWGLHSTELFVDKTVENSPAQKVGIQKGDRLTQVNGESIESFYELKDAIQAAGEKTGKVIVTWERAGQTFTQNVEPTVTTSRDALLKKTTTYTIGVMPMLTWREAAMVIERVWNPFLLLYKAIERTVVLSWRNLVSIKKMITGTVSVSTLGGPILIGKIAGESMARGLISFLTTMAILSVGLGVLNLLPIPILDGGHLLLLGIEAIRKKPLTIRQREVIQQIGLSLILLLMVVVIKNDLARLF